MNHRVKVKLINIITHLKVGPLHLVADHSSLVSLGLGCNTQGNCPTHNIIHMYTCVDKCVFIVLCVRECR